MPKFPALEEATGELNALRKGLKSVFDEAGPDLDMSKVKSISGDKIAWIREQKSQIDKAAEKVAELKEVLDIAGSSEKEFFEQGGHDNYKDNGPSTKSLGQAFTESRAFKNYVGGQGPVAHTDVNLKDVFSVAGLGGADPGWVPESTRSGKVLLSALRPAQHVVTYYPTSTINQVAYKYMEETLFDAELTGTEGDGSTPQVDDSSGLPQEINEGATFAEAALKLEERDAMVQKIAVWIPVTDEQLEDVEGAQAYVNQRLTTMLHMRVDRQLLLGNGSAPNLKGTEAVITAGGLTQAKGTDSIPDATLKLFTNIRTTSFSEPSVAFIHPSKWQEVQLMKTADGQYIWNHPSTTGPATLWGVPVVPTTVVSSTKLVTGDFATHASFMVKRGIEMQITNAHDDFFINGKQAIRADLRAVVVHFRPTAFGAVTGL